ncbi:hypothetical protein P171DRAFT_430342 [Karstenula rhodostoma CBS 690.94]|uniref:ADP-ribose 1''-phosphate phosphatase n=1 Tax=Karstenula rhodostoma CBS 690.94 TaxID=1392251 RepID=A0A9P4PMQ4_9PLEO|nr:hypothetical protein P171DRAFT_430342 [Karstenula rhodostoma CBS 690.94]
MSAIRLGAAVNVREFQSLINSLDTHQGHTVDPEALQDEFGRFRVWSGNLGVLQKGHSSLDYRLRDAPLLSNEVSKLLKELEENLRSAYDIVSGARLPYEQQSRPAGSEDEDGDDSFFSEDEDEGSDPDVPKTELSMRFREVVDIIDHLYKISVRIRAPTVHTRSLKATSYQPKDPETGVDLLAQYAIFDNIHTRELVRHLRMPHISAGERTEENDDLVDRLARAVTLRRRQFKYWRRHRDKLGISTFQEEPQTPAAVQRPEAPHRHDTLEAQPGTPGIDPLPKQAPSQRTGKTLLSGTEATHHHQSLDDIVDSKSITSYAVTVKDLSGKGINLPPPPKAADGDKDFECPYCFIICPARYGKGRPWRTHLLQDLQPYVCTYLECQGSDQLFRSRRDWFEHESTHRKAWRCPEHPEAVYNSYSGLEEHIRKHHGDSVPEGQIPSIVKVGETSTIDLRKKCPICWASVETEGMGTLQNHIANHLERIAAFSLPIDVDDDSDGGSSRASRGGTNSSAIPTASRSSGDSDYSGYSNEQEIGVGTLPAAEIILGHGATDQRLECAVCEETLEHTLRDERILQLPCGHISHDACLTGYVRAFLQHCPVCNVAFELENSRGRNVLDMKGTSTQPGLLSESLIRALPDDSGQRLNLFFSSQPDDVQNSEEEDQEEEDIFDETGLNVEEHMAEREAFRKYLLSLEGAQSVRFYKRYGLWNGNINFQDGDSAARALQTFDKEQYPSVQLSQKDAKKETLKFRALYAVKPVANSFDPDIYVAQTSLPYSESSGSQHDSTQSNIGDIGGTSPILDVADIPSIRALYRSSKLAPQDDPSYVPNDDHNGIVAFCYYDITRLKVDAIVNSSNRGLAPSRAEWTLNSIIHKAAGPGLGEECSRIDRLKVSQSVLTGGYNLPCTHVIHVARPHYASSKGMAQYNLLTEGYRSALKLAMKKNLQTIAFCCLGTGGIGFPTRIAARIALQEVREFLDAHPRHSFKRIVFCVYTEDDSMAYTDFFSNFFPPTREDLDTAISNKGNKNVARLSALIQEVYTQVDVVTQQMKTFNAEATNMPQRVVQQLSSIAVLLETFKEIASEAETERLLSRMMRYIDLLCSVMNAICGHLTEMTELAKAKENLGFPGHNVIWDDHNNHMYSYQRLTIVELVDITQEFAQHLYDVLEHDVAVPHEMKTIGSRLETWLTIQTGSGPQSTRDHFEEVMLTREYQRDVPVSKRTDTVKLHQVPTLAQLYQQGILPAKDTQVRPSVRFNDILCLAQEDITKLEVDILVSSTDTEFSGIGRLDRTVFLGGGPELQQEIASHAPCNEGEVILTGGYSLSAKHVLHAIPPAIYRTDTLQVLRDMYRKILHMASYLKATSIAIPTLGTGMLNYPRRDSAATALSEVKEFLEFQESNEQSNSIEKIVLVVFSSNDEFVYKSILPTYFPPVSLSVDHSESIRSSPIPIPQESRGLLTALGDQIRKLGPGKQSTSNIRPLEPTEEDLLIVFEKHAQGCPTCSNISKLYTEGRDLCDDGYRFAAQILRHLHMRADQSVYPLRSVEDFPLEVEIPDVFPLSLELLHTVEKSFRDPDRDRPFVSNQPSLGLKGRIPEYAVYNIEVTVSNPPHLQQAFDRIYIWSDPSSGIQHFEAPVSTLHLTRGALLIRQGGFDNDSKPPKSLNLSPRSIISVQSGTEIVVDDVIADGGFAHEISSRFTLGVRSQSDCKMLLTRVKHAAENSPSSAVQEDPPRDAATHGAEATIPPQGQYKNAFAKVFRWSPATESWKTFDAEQSEAFLSVRPGSLEILQRASESTWRLKLTSYSIIKEQAGVEILIDRVTTAGDTDTELGRWKRIMLKFRSQSERDSLLASLRHAADFSGRPPTPSQPPTPTQTTSGTQSSFREDLEALDQRLENRVQNLSEQLQSGQLAELDSLSVPTVDPVSTSNQSHLSLSEDINKSQNMPTDVQDQPDTAPATGTEHQEPQTSEPKPDANPKLPSNDDVGNLPPDMSPGPTAISVPTDSIAASDASSDVPPAGSSASPASLIDPKLIPLEELNIEAYFKHVPRDDFPDSGKVYTHIDKRLVYEEVLREASLWFFDVGEGWIVLQRVEKEEVLRFHEETRKMHRFTPQEHSKE